MIKDRLVSWLLKEFNLSKADIEKVSDILDKVNVTKIGDKTIIEVKLNKISVVLEGENSVY